jgi:glycosyltransferase involved in cell wall biosynthesis
MSAATLANRNLVVLMPVFNDWQALTLLLPRLDQELKASALRANILLVDDGSTVASPARFGQSFEAVESIDILSLRRNLGHQRAIAVGLSYIEANHSDCSVVIMDSDGEDNPADVPRLVRECWASNSEKIVFAARMRRSEGWAFTFFYQFYRLVHFLLTGIPVRVGNFSVVPAAALTRLVAVSELWNHYAAAVHKAKLPLSLIPTERSPRLEGEAHMDLVSLVVHGLCAMAVFGDRIGVRLLILVSLGMFLMVAGLLGVAAIRFTTDLAIPGWATYVTGLLLVMLMQMLLVVLVFVFVILAGRNAANVIPTRDYIHIMGAIHRIYG